MSRSFATSTEEMCAAEMCVARGPDVLWQLFAKLRSFGHGDGPGDAGPAHSAGGPLQAVAAGQCKPSRAGIMCRCIVSAGVSTIRGSCGARDDRRDTFDVDA